MNTAPASAAAFTADANFSLTVFLVLSGQDRTKSAMVKESEPWKAARKSKATSKAKPVAHPQKREKTILLVAEIGEEVTQFKLHEGGLEKLLGMLMPDKSKSKVPHFLEA